MKGPAPFNGLPNEDPFVIETDKVLGVGGQGTVYLCHKQWLGSRALPMTLFPILGL